MKVLLVDGVGRAAERELPDARFLPSIVEIKLGQQRVEIQEDGTRVVISGVKFERTDVKDNGLLIYRMAGIPDRPAIRRGYR